MKVVVIADLHLGFAYGSERQEDSFRNAAEAFSKALAEKPDCILMLGDIFHDKIPKPEIMARALELFRTLRSGLGQTKLINLRKGNKETMENRMVPPILGIYGTHERRNVGSVNPVHILEKAGMLFYLHQESAVIELGGERLGLHGMSGVPDQFALETLKNWAPTPFPGVPNIIMFHQTFKELIPEVQNDVLSYTDLPKGFNLYLLGHIHWNVEDKHASGAPILIPGSTVKTQMRKVEAKRNKGFYILDIKEKRIHAAFHKIDGERVLYYETYKVDKQKPSDIVIALSKKTEELISYHNQELKPLIRFKLAGKLAEGFLPTDLYFSGLTKRFGDRALLFFDKANVESSKLSQRAKLLKDLKDQKISVNQLGFNLLFQNLKLKDKKTMQKVEQVFEHLAAAELDKAEELL